MSAANRGRPLELRLELMHRAYRARGVGEVFTTPPPVRIVSSVKGGRFSAVYTSKGPPDFAGILSGGRGVLIEAKTSRASRWPLARLEAHQAGALDRCATLGGVALVVLDHPSGIYALDWRTLGPRWRQRASGIRGEASLGAADLVEVGRRLVGVDWLSGLD